MEAREEVAKKVSKDARDIGIGTYFSYKSLREKERLHERQVYGLTGKSGKGLEEKLRGMIRRHTVDGVALEVVASVERLCAALKVADVLAVESQGVGAGLPRGCRRGRRRRKWSTGAHCGARK